jgi:hypothetical protein
MLLACAMLAIAAPADCFADRQVSRESQQPPRYRSRAREQALHFIVRVTDEATGRGVPLVELKLPNEVKYWTDSAGIAALREPSFTSREVFVQVSSHGYEFPKETFLGRGVNLTLKPGGRAEIQVRRTMIAERLYRITGEGIYRDSELAGLAAPVRDPSFNNGQVLGQDTAVETVYRGKLFWIWGDTIGPAFWNFSVTAATSELPGRGGLDPAKGVELRYFTGTNSRAKAMLPLPRKGLVWIEGLFTVKDREARERLLATYTLQQGLKPPDECGVAIFQDDKEQFEPWFQYPCYKESHRSSHPFLYRDGVVEYWYLYPWLRVPNDWDAVRDIARWQRREFHGPANSGRASSAAWNPFRNRFVLLLENTGEVWYAEAQRPEGPYGAAVKIVEHRHYNFYNVAQHPRFEQEGGRVIYFEGTFTDSFSDAKEKTPRYNYNQIMYRLRLDDPRLIGAQTR